MRRRSAALGAVKGSTPAIAFSEPLGGSLAGEFNDPGPLWDANNPLYFWDDIEALIAKAI